MKKAVLVYQGGIANVFAVHSFNMSEYGANRLRLLQADFNSCECYARGLVTGGVMVTSAQCNQAGDIRTAHWSETLTDAPFFDKMRPVYSPNVAH